MTRAPDPATAATPARAASSGGAMVTERLRTHYRLRTLGLALSGIAAAAVLLEQQAGIGLWLAWLISFVLWPHLAWLHARGGRDRHRKEVRNLLMDSALAGLWVPLMHFNLLPSVAVVSVATVDKISTAIPGLWQRSLLAVVLAMLLGGVATGFAVDAHTSQAVMLATLPLLVVHSIAVSLSLAGLARTLQRKNRTLDELANADGLTGLSTRRHWQGQLADALQQHHRDGTPAALVMIDVDRFKQVNDSHGHAVGDALLREVTRGLRAWMPPGACAGRYGGDELGLLVTGAHVQDLPDSLEQLRQRMHAITLPGATGLQPSISIGMAAASADIDTDDAWIERADAALYEAKRLGRDRLVVASALA